MSGKMNDIMDKIIEVTGGGEKGSSNSFLVVGENKTALIDCGMAYFASTLINNIKGVLGDERKLDYILLSHSHYDHIGAVPYLRKVWPEVKVMAAGYAQNVLKKQSVLKTIKELSNQAGKYYGIAEAIDYDDALMKVEQKISYGDVLDLGGVSIAVLETPGHTQCSLSFLVNGEVIFASETTGLINESGKIQAQFINSYKEAIKSIKKCQEANPRLIIAPHFGPVSKRDTLNYWQKCIQASNEARDFVLKLFEAGADEERVFEEFQNAFFDQSVQAVQPKNAFQINNRAMIRTIIKEK